MQAASKGHIFIMKMHVHSRFKFNVSNQVLVNYQQLDKDL